MKRRLITRILLSLAVVLTALQANAQLRVRLLADTSGLAKGTNSDSFPNVKSDLYSWFSVKPDGSGIYLRPSKGADNTKIKAEAQADLGSVFKVSFFQNDSTKFSITPLNGASPLALETKDEVRTPYFSLMTQVSEGVGRYAKLREGGGYLVYDPGIASPRLDTVKVALVGADRKGNLSLRYFNEFAIYGDPLPNPDAFLDFQYGKYKEDQRFDRGRLYQSTTFPFFQIYNADTAVIAATGNGDGSYNGTAVKHEATNWGHWTSSNNPNVNDSIVYTWFRAEVKSDTAIVLLNTAIRLDSIVDFVGYMDSLYLKPPLASPTTDHSWKGFDTLPAKDKPDSVRRFADEQFVYLKKTTDNLLSFTVKIDSGNGSSDWTNGYPELFKYKDGHRYYRIDTAMMYVLADVVNHFKFLLIDNGYPGTTNAQANALDSLFYPSLNQTDSLYLYKNKEDGWRPLYIKAEEVPQNEAERTYEYVGTKWVKENNFHISSALQEAVVTGLKDKAISDANDGAVLVEKDSPTAARFIFEVADTIKTGNKWFSKDERAIGKYPNNKGGFRNDKDVELFRIKYEKENARAKYLTVLDTIEFGTTAGALKNTVGWDTLLNDARGSALQLFAIARNYLDSSVTFLPVAAPRWHNTDTKTDTLTFNLGIGKKDEGSEYVRLSNNGVWHLESSYTYKLVIADSQSTIEPLRFKLNSTLIPWEGPAYQDGYVASVQQKRTGNYYGVDSSFVKSATADHIRTHWRVKKDTTDDKTKWEFVPVTAAETFHGEVSSLVGKNLSVFKYDNEHVVLQDKDGKLLDTVKVEYNINPADFGLFGKVGDVAGITLNSGKSKVVIQNDGKYIAFPAVHADSTFAVTFRPLDTAGESFSAITVYSSDTVYLNAKDTLYPVYYYTFAYNGGKNNKYYLKANKDSIAWVRLAAAPERDSAFKFSLPFDIKENKQKVYLLDKANQVIAFNGDGSGLIAKAQGSDIYAFSNDLFAGSVAALRWTLHDGGSDAVEEWVHIASIDSVNGKATGVLRSADFEGRVVAAETGSTRYGFLSSSADVKLTFKQSRASERVSTDPTFYYIIADETYSLTEASSDIVFAADGKQDFAFAKVKDSDRINIVSVDAEDDRYLTIKGLNQYRLAFTPDREDALSFELEIDETSTGIQIIGASSAKVYGVAGGVKVANASGAVAIYAIDGRLVTAQAVTSPNQTIAVPAGIYIVRNGAEVTKVIVK